MKKMAVVILTVLLMPGLAASQGKKSSEVTIIGEVVETQCYVTGLTGPGKGPAHKECAINCAKGGIPLSILEDKSGKLYLGAQSKKGMSGANEMLMPFIAEKVKVTGRVYEKGGMKLILIRNIEGLIKKKEK